MMHTLYKAVAFPILPLTLPTPRLIIRCSSAASGAMSASPESWPSAASPPNTPQLDPQQPAANARKRLLVAGVDQAELVDPWLLADADSRFAELHGVHLHYKIASTGADDAEQQSQGTAQSRKSYVDRDDLVSREGVDDRGLYARSSLSSSPLSHPPSDASSSLTSPPSSEGTSPRWQSLPAPNIPAILLHGFGASLFSWERIMRRLADILRSHVIAFDRPAFGLTSRIDVPLIKDPSGEGVPATPNPYSVAFSSAATIAFIDFMKANNAVLIGHSAGCIIAADAYLKAPERVAALIMVAPALFAPLASRKKGQSHQVQSSGNNIFAKVWLKFISLFSKVREFIQFVISSVQLLWYRLLAAFLRSDAGRWLIRTVMDKLSLQAVRMAWFDKKKIDDYVIAGYTKPLKCRHWERALLEYVIAVVGDPSGRKGELPISQRLTEIQCPVLVITGDSDALVPAWNAERLSRIFPKGQYCVIKNCGHLPQEETPEEFLKIIHQFMQQVQQGTTMERPTNESVVFMPA